MAKVSIKSENITVFERILYGKIVVSTLLKSICSFVYKGS